MLCRECRWKECQVKAGVRDHRCHWTGAAVPPFTMQQGHVNPDGSPQRERDDRSYFCPLTLDRLLYRAGDRRLAVGIMRQVDARGRLCDLLEQYRPALRDKLGGLYHLEMALAV